MYSRTGRILLADEPGLGKTAQAINCIVKAQDFPCLVVTPPSLKYNWKEEIGMWASNTCSLFSRKSKNDTDFVIISYGMLRYVDYHKFNAIIFDESHYLKNSKTSRTKTAIKVSRHIPNKILLSGSSILNCPVELVPQIEILGMMNVFGSKAIFLERYCLNGVSKFGVDYTGAHKLGELHMKLTEIGFIRRLKKDVLHELSSKIHTIIPINLDNRKTYNRIASKPHKNWLVQENKLRQACAIGKIKRGLDFISSLGDTPVVIFCLHVSVGKSISEELKCPFIYGETTMRNRQMYVQEFQKGQHQYIVLSMEVAGIGFTLTRSHNVVFFEYPWSSEVLKQCIDRCHRIGQTMPVNIWYLFGKDTIDTTSIFRISHKHTTCEAVNDGNYRTQNLLQILIEESE